MILFFLFFKARALFLHAGKRWFKCIMHGITELVCFLVKVGEGYFGFCWGLLGGGM